MHSWAVLPASLDSGDALTNQLTLKPAQVKSPYTFVLPRPAIKELIRQEDGTVWVPRAWGVDYLDRQGLTVTDERTLLDPVDFQATMELRETQRAVVDQTLKALRNDRYAGGATVEGVPGSGKTVVCLKVASELRQPTLVVVHTTGLLKQWQKRIKKFTDLADNQIGVIKGAKSKPKPGAIVTVAMLQTLCSPSFPIGTWRDRFGTLIFDECDLFPTEVFRTVLSLFAARYRVACTATLKRRDGLHQLLAWHVGGVTGKMLKPEAIPKICRVNHKMFVNTSRFSWRNPKGEVRVSLARMLQVLAADPSRNEKLVRALIASRKRDRITIGLSHHKDHLATVAAGLRKEGYAPAFFTGDQKEEELEFAITQPLILGTYAMMGRGIDIEQIETIGLLLPLADVQQPVGRVLRSFPGKKTPIVIDVVDTMVDINADEDEDADELPPTQRMWRGREGWYNKIGAEIVIWKP
jgi:superfamily II DNA or RNA helicase